MRAELNLADDSEEGSEGFGPIFLSDPRGAPRGGPDHRSNSGCRSQGNKRGGSDLTHSRVTV